MIPVVKDTVIRTQPKPKENLVPFQCSAAIGQKLSFVDPSVHRLLGWSGQEMMSTHLCWSALVHPADRQDLFSKIHSLTPETPIQCDYRIRCRDGYYKRVRSQFSLSQNKTLISGHWLDLSIVPSQPSREQRYTLLLESIVEVTSSLFKPSELEQGMSQVLAKIGAVAGVDQIYFLGMDGTSNLQKAADSTQRETAPPNFFAWARHSPHARHSPGHWLKEALHQPDHHPIWQHLFKGRSLQGEAQFMPAELSKCLTEQKIHSILLLPIIQEDQFSGVLGIENRDRAQDWYEHEILALQHLTQILGAALKQFHAESRLSHYAFHDPLTELPNRALLLNRLEQCIKRKARHSNYSFAVLFLDLDRFKPVNDRLGHDVGDHLLIQVAQRLSRCVRPSDTVARLGGDEFVILLDEIVDISDAELVIQRLRNELTRHFHINGNDIHIDVSVGIALSSMDYDSAEAILQEADLEMYRAKHAGRD